MTIIPPVPKPDQTQLDCLESLPNTTSLMLHRWDEWHSHSTNGRMVPGQVNANMEPSILTNDKTHLLF